MTADEAREIHSEMRQLGIAGTLRPADPEKPNGAWLVVDAEGRDTTAHVLTRVACARMRQPERGFVIAR
ncbi:hypothetical protein ACFWP3_28945 [Streptomyces sp. NPDC058525]|uniref:hypothetical protein n=1 Tax=unclassified Streptomyces TaxID=2593676 RepID=UPI003651F10F